MRVLGLATAFEDFDKNTLENLRMLAETGEVVGETREALSSCGQLQDGNRIPFRIPFPLAMDNLTKIAAEEVSQEKIMEFIYSKIPQFDARPEEYRNQMIERVRNYMKAREHSAETFEKFSLQGTPSMILVDRKGVLRDVSFGQSGRLEAKIGQLLGED